MYHLNIHEDGWGAFSPRGLRPEVAKFRLTCRRRQKVKNSSVNGSDGGLKHSFDRDGAARPCAHPVHSAGAVLRLRPRRPRPLSAARAANVRRSSKAMLVRRADRRINVQLTAADAQFSAQMVLTRHAQVGGALFRRHETTLSVLTRLVGRCVEELCVTTPEERST